VASASVKKAAPAAVLSMTGFGSAEGKVGVQRYRVEMKSVNHRYLDLKLRIPRELQSAEVAIKSFLQARLSRGAVEMKIDRITDAASAPQVEVALDAALAKRYYEKLKELQAALGLNDPIQTSEIAGFPDVLSRGSEDLTAEETWKQLEPIVGAAVEGLAKMRKHEGEALSKVLLDAASDLERTIALLREKRQAVSAKYPERIREKIKGIFEAHPLSEGNIQAVLESRISQELALLADRTDVEEELVRFQGHLDHLRKVLREGGQVGRKLDFILQELNREINTLGNKAQDYGMSEEVVGSKVRLEQLREQVMNIE
jgi:uncharacterized protein (TIGR00255 family)